MTKKEKDINQVAKKIVTLATTPKEDPLDREEILDRLTLAHGLFLGNLAEHPAIRSDEKKILQEIVGKIEEVYLLVELRMKEAEGK